MSFYKFKISLYFLFLSVLFYGKKYQKAVEGDPSNSPLRRDLRLPEFVFSRLISFKKTFSLYKNPNLRSTKNWRVTPARQFFSPASLPALGGQEFLCWNRSRAFSKKIFPVLSPLPSQKNLSLERHPSKNKTFRGQSPF